MERYKVTYTATVSYEVIVEANCGKEAEELAEDEAKEKLNEIENFGDYEVDVDYNPYIEKSYGDFNVDKELCKISGELWLPITRSEYC